MRRPLRQIRYDSIVRGTNDIIPVSFKRKISEDEIVPYDLTGKLLILTVKKQEFDDNLEDSSTEKSLVEDYMFRITIDCDDPTEGGEGPVDDRDIWKNNYQGMYGMNPEEGKAIFRISKKMTMIKPDEYNFDIRILEKTVSKVGEINECKDYCPIFGTLEIQGTPTNRTQYDWED